MAIMALSGVFAAVINEGFEGTTFPPADWTRVGTSWARSTTYPYQGVASARVGYTSGQYWLITPKLKPAVGANTLTFWYRDYSESTSWDYPDEYTYVKISTATNDVADFTTILWTGDYLDFTLTYQQAGIDLSAYNGQEIYVAFHHVATGGNYRYIDDVTGVDLAPAGIPNPAVIGAPANNALNVAINPTLSWSSGGGAPSGYDVYFNGSLVSSNQPGLTYLPGTLAYSTTYTWQIIPRNEAGAAEGCPVWSFTTMADPVVSSFPWSVNFGTLAADWLPLNWTKHSGILADPTTLGAAGTGSWFQDDWLNVTTPLNKAAKVNIYGTTATSAQGWLITPPIQMPGAGYQLEFDIAYMAWDGLSTPPGMDGTDDRFEVLIGDGSSWTPANIVRSWDNAGSAYVLNNVSPSGDHVIIDISGHTGVKHIAFYVHNGAVGGRDNDFMLDNVLIRETPTGAPGAPILATPANGATGLSKNGFNITWTPAITGGIADYYAVYMSQDEANLFSDEYFEVFVGTSFNPVSTGGITFAYDQLWYWTVEAVNGSGSALPDDPFNFRIEQDPTISTLPWTEGFEGATFPPYGWSRLDADGDGQNWFLYNADGSAHTGLQSAASASWTSSTGALSPNNWLITPPIAIPAAGEYMVEYYVGAQDPTYPDDHYGFYVSTTGTAPADFTLLFEETLTDGNWYYRSQNLAAYAGQTVRFAFRHFDSYDWFYMKIDDVGVREVPETPVLAITPEVWDFGTMQVMNPSTPKSFTLANVGADTINILDGDIVLNQTGTDFVLVAQNLPAALSGSTTYDFTVQFIPQSVGTKTATVTIQDNITRVIHTINLTGEAIPEPIASVVALQGTVETQVNARLNWASIYGDPTQAGYVHWDDSVQRGNVGAGASPFHAVAKYGTEVTALAAGKVLDGVMIHLAEEPQLITAVKVWTGTDVDLMPVTLVLEQAVSGLTVGWNYVAFSTPIPVSGTDALYLGYYSTGMLDVFPGSTDGLTGVNGRGNIVELGGAWNTLTGYSIAGNWLIHAHFEEAGPIMAGRRPVVLQNIAVNNVELENDALRNSPIKARMNGNMERVIRGFNIYRDGVQINGSLVTAYTYLDEGLAVGTYNYAAQAVHYSANGPISGTVPVTIDPPADPFALPFLEDWASGDYATNMWSIGSDNWVINTTTGNPAPSASFSWSPQVTDYSSVLASYEFDATGIASVQFSFDLYLNNYDTEAENTMTWQIWDGTAWYTLGSYTSLDDDLGWYRYAYDISAYAANRVFKIRFVAEGEDSYSINYWYIDNIYLAFLPAAVDPITDLSISTDGVTIDLDWTAVPNATWYMIYASEDPYGTFTPLGYVPSAGASIPAAMLPTAKAFVNVTAGTGPFPAGRNLSE
jgi:hypothetical protein